MIAANKLILLNRSDLAMSYQEEPSHAVFVVGKRCDSLSRSGIGPEPTGNRLH